MIGSHDTFTYLKPTNKLHNLTKKWWRTQCKTIEEQYNFGIRFFDIRVYLDSDNHWRFCHGIVDFKRYERTLNDICLYMENYFPKAIYRIVLEKGNSSVRDIFVSAARGLCEKYPNLWRIDIKSSKNWLGAVDNNNQKLFKRGYKFALVNTWESPAHELHGNLKEIDDIFYTNLRKDARAINSTLPFFIDEKRLKNMIKSKSELYFIDYCTNEY